MEHLKGFNEGFFDYFKKDTDDDKIALKFLNRLEKVKGDNPYNLKILIRDNLPIWLVKFQSNNKSNDSESEYYSIVYIIKFDDVDMVITNNKSSLIHRQSGLPAGHRICKNPWKLYIGSSDTDLGERIRAKESIRKKIFQVTDKLYNDDKNKKRINRIISEINPAADLIDESLSTKEITFTNKRNPNTKIVVSKNPDGRISLIDNKSSFRFPFSVGQIMNRSVEVWACNNGFLMDDKDMCPEKKIFGIRVSDVPKGHEWRHIFPNKF